MQASTKKAEVMGKRLAMIRHKYHLSQEQLAEKMSLTRLSIINYEKGKHAMSEKALFILFQEFPEINQDWFMYGRGTMISKDAQMQSEVREPAGEYKNVMVDIKDVLIGYFSEMEILKELFVNKQNSYRSAIESLKNK